MPISKEKERLSARIPIQAYQTLIHAVEISGVTLNQFLVQAAVQKAQMIIEKDQTIIYYSGFNPSFPRDGYPEHL